MKSNDINHISVLLDKSIELLNIKEDGIYLDMTLGASGHSLKIYEKLSDKGLLICFDQDELAISHAKNVFKDKENVIIINDNFVNFKEHLIKLNITRVDGIIYDLGVSSMQLDLEKRGFSYRFDSKLDMRMDQKQLLSAYDVVNEYSFNELFFIFKNYGEEKFAKEIARNIEKTRLNKKIETTFELVDIIKSSMPQKELKKKGHPAKKVFQAIRIEVNKELDVLTRSIEDAINCLNIKGRIVVISFHSLEDRIVKKAFRDKTTSKLPKELVDIRDFDDVNYRLINKKVIVPSDDELTSNYRAHSSKLRCLERLK